MESSYPAAEAARLLDARVAEPIGVWRMIARFARKEPIAALCGIVLLASLIIAAFAPWIAPYDPNEQEVINRIKSPSSEHWAGTDGNGRDVFSRIIVASRYSLGVGFGATALATLGALAIGITSVYAGRNTDLIFQRLVDATMSIPPLLLLIFIVALIGPGIWTVIVVIGFLSAIRNSRVIRGSTLEVMSQDYLDSARVIGATWPRIVLRYVLPNIMAPVIVLFSLGLGAAILTESTLSFLGYGVPPPDPTWGQMLGLDARRLFVVAPWTAISPGVALTVVVFAINIFGDALRDRLDPRQRGA